MNDLAPLVTVIVAVVLSVAVVGTVGFLSWFWVRHRQAELTVTTDEQAARILGESLGTTEASPEVVREVMAVFAQVDSPARRAIAMAVAGLVANVPYDAEPRILAIVRGFVNRADGTTAESAPGPDDSAYFDPARSRPS